MKSFQFINKFNLPLFGKELIEQAARKRTYVIRMVYSSALFLFFAMAFSELVRGQRYGHGYEVLGQGMTLFGPLIAMQFAGIFLFLPAIMSGVITAEKEKESLGLLFLTDIGPWELLLQKYLGRLVPMFSFLLLSVPLMALAYSLGGISSDYLYSSILMLFLTCLQVGALALMFSAFCRTSVGAFLASYLGGAVFYLGPLVVASILDLSPSMAREIFTVHIPPFVMMEYWGQSFSDVAAHSWVIVLSTVLFLLVARLVLLRRAFVTPRNVLLAFFKSLDRTFNRMNKVTGGVLIWRQDNSFPADEPVAWREMEKRSLGRLSYLIRIFLVLEGATLLLGLFLLIGRGYNRNDIENMSAMLFVLWVLAALTVTVQAANSMASERLYQTLEVLLTTPLSGADIVRQKMRGLRRIMFVLAVPLLTVVGLETWWRIDTGVAPNYYSPYPDTTLYLFPSVLAVLIYLPMIAWGSMWISLKVRTRSRAIMVALVALVGWCVLPILALGILDGILGLFSVNDHHYLFLFSPATAVVLSEVGEWVSVFDYTHATHYQGAYDPSLDGVYGAIFLNFALYGAVLFLLRRRCLKHADRYLRHERGA